MALTTLPTNDLSLTKIGGLGGLAGAEISGYDAASKRLFTTASTRPSDHRHFEPLNARSGRDAEPDFA